MAKIAAVRFFDGLEKITTLWTGTSKFDQNTDFLPSSISPTIDRALKGFDWVDLRTDDLLLLDTVNRTGTWRFAGRDWFPVWIDAMEGYALFVPKDSGIRSLEDMLHPIIITTKDLTQIGKVEKYGHRYFAPPAHGSRLITGDYTGVEVVKYHGHSFDMDHVLLDNGRSVRVIYDDMKWMSPEEKAVADGTIVIGPDASSALELKGFVNKVTFGTRRGLGKGQTNLNPRMGNVIHIFGPKTQHVVKDFTFVNLGEAHVGDPHTDMQSWINFRYDRKELGPALAYSFMKELLASSKDYDKLQSVLLRYVFNAEKNAMPDPDSMLVRKAVLYDIPILSRQSGPDDDPTVQPGHPGLWRRVYRQLLVLARKCAAGRVPMTGKALYGYVCPEPAIFNELGFPDLTKSQIDENEIIVPDLAGGTKIVAYRQPNENPNAWVTLTAVMNDAYEGYRGYGLCFLGRGAYNVLSRLGGGDMDDTFVIVFDPIWVNAFMELPTYPETEKVGDVEVIRHEFEGNPDYESFVTDLTDDDPWEVRAAKPYGKREFAHSIEMAMETTANLGYIVNYIMHLVVLLDERNHDGIRGQLKDNAEALAWYEALLAREQRPDALLASNLERIIDGNVKDRSLLLPLMAEIKGVNKFHKTAMVYAKSLESRIPDTKRRKGDFVLVETSLCASFQQIATYSEMLDEAFARTEWAIVGRADRDVLDYFPSTKETRDFIASRKEVWYAEWTKTFEKGLTEDERKAAYARIEALVDLELEGVDDDTLKMYAVEGYRQAYRRPYNEPKLDEKTGKIKSYFDASLWTSKLGNALIMAFVEVGKAGLNWPVELMPEFKYYFHRNAHVKVLFGAVLVIHHRKRGDEEELIGYVPTSRVRDGEYDMIGGVIRVKPSTLGLDTDK